VARRGGGFYRAIRAQSASGFCEAKVYLSAQSIRDSPVQRRAPSKGSGIQKRGRGSCVFNDSTVAHSRNDGGLAPPGAPILPETCKLPAFRRGAVLGPVRALGKSDSSYTYVDLHCDGLNCEGPDEGETVNKPIMIVIVTTRVVGRIPSLLPT